MARKNRYDFLGVDYTKQYSDFALFATEAEKVEVVLLQGAGNRETKGFPEEGEKCTAYEMEETEDDLWQVRVEGDLKQLYYLYRITRSTGVTYSRDPYATAMGINGVRSAIVDLTETVPAEFEKYCHVPLASPVDAVVWEVHIRDFSMDEGIAFQHRGKFLSLTEQGLKTKQGNAAGVDSLKELGITHVQLLPVYDSAVVDERHVDDEDYKGKKYNWGYDPHNYNVPEGCYSTDPADPMSRIRECKEMVKELHKMGIGVIMDVVFNHTFGIEDGPFEAAAPGYFYRKVGDKYANGSMCGNEVASERPMVRAFIKNSLKYWVREYGMDGFRFDLMGLIDTETMKMIGEELRRECHEDILLYGEPWQAGGSPLPEEQQTLKGSQKGLGFGVFNDVIRDALRGSTKGRDGAFALGRGHFEKALAESVQGSIHTFAQIPGESVNYVGAHDDLNLWDKIITAMGQRQKEGFLNLHDGVLKRGSLEKALAGVRPHQGIEEGKAGENQTVRACLLANSVVLLSQGIPFLFAGDELLRSKYGDSNSFRSGDFINTIRWNDRDRFPEVFDYYRELLGLRKAHPAFRMNDRQMVEEKLRVVSQGDGMISFLLGEHANGDEWKYIYVCCSGKMEEREVSFPFSADWHLALALPGEDRGEAERKKVLAARDIQVWYAE